MKTLTLGFALLLGACGGSHEMQPGHGHEHAGHDGHHRGPTPEAREACADKQDGDACTMKHHDESITGKCAKPPEGRGEGEQAELACRPEGPPPAARN